MLKVSLVILWREGEKSRQVHDIPSLTAPEASAGGDFPIQIVHIQAAAVQDCIWKVVWRNILDAPIPVEGAQILQKLLLHKRGQLHVIQGRV